jgi:hypothetical protein
LKIIATLHNEIPDDRETPEQKIDKELFRRLPVVGFSISKFLRTNVISAEQGQQQQQKEKKQQQRQKL